MAGSETGIKKKELIDSFGRAHSYLRLSITDDCNFSCSYCKPENKTCENKRGLMLPEEIIQLAKEFILLGIKKIRFTGGEPLVYPQFEYLIKALKDCGAELALTTNGYLLDRHFSTLQAAGVKKINISLDSLKPDRFKSITGRNAFERVYANLLLAIKLRFDVKVNAVIIRGVNDDELIDFARLAMKYPIAVRFIEFMPFRDNNWSFGKTLTQEKILKVLLSEFTLQEEETPVGQTSVYYKVEGAKGKIGLIGTLSHPFCENCNRIRIMADGKIKNCLFGTEEYDLIGPYRQGQDLQTIIHKALCQKELEHGGQHLMAYQANSKKDNRNMFAIGG